MRSAWRDVTPLHNQLVDAILSCKMHVIATMRSKMEYALEKDDKTGKNSVRKIGLAPIQREGLDFEFTVVGDLNLDHQLIISKSRCSIVGVGDVIDKPGEKFARTLRDWLNSGAVPAAAPAPVAVPARDTSVDAAMDSAFAKYMDNLKTATDLASLEKAAVAPGKPSKGTEQHRAATALYLACKAELSKVAVSA